MKNVKSCAVIVAFFLGTTSVAGAEPDGLITCQPVNAGPLTPWAQNACALDHSKNPESWVRGWATFDRATSVLTVHLNVETDSTTGGPCGTIKATLRDAKGEALASLSSENQICLGGKPPGRAVHYDWIRSASLSAEIAKRAVTVDVNVNRTKNIDSIWGLGLEQIADAVKAISTILAAG